MPDGTFTYTLTLPVPQNNQNVKIKYAESLDSLESSAQIVDQTKQQSSDSVTASDINHFTIFIVYSQTENLWGAYTSQHNTSATPNSYFAPGDTAAVYDNFTLGSNTSITGINWRGVYYDGPPQPQNGANSAGSYGYGPAAPGTISGFTIKIYSDIIDSSGGSLNGLHRPNIEAGPIYTAPISGNAGETDLGYTDSEHVYYGPNEIYSYGTTLATPFAATGGTKYWLSIVAESPFAPEWGWNTAGVVGSGLAYRQDQGDSTLKKNISGADFTFSLSRDDSVPTIVYANNTYSAVFGTTTSDGHTVGIDAFPTIQGAVNAVVSGGTVNVAAGTYTEQLTINKNITIKGAGSSTTTIQAPGTLATDGDGAKDIVLVTGSITAEISGFTIQGPVTGLNFGIYVRAGATAKIHDNTIKDIRDNPFSGSQIGIAIEVGKYPDTAPIVSQVGHATIKDNIISGYQKTGISVEYTGSNATITGNTITGAGSTTITAQNGIQIRRGAVATIKTNTVTGNAWNGPTWSAEGIGALRAGNGVIIQGNIVNHNSSNIYSWNSDGLQVLDNQVSDSATVDQNASAGITVQGAGLPDPYGGAAGPYLTGVTISGNTIQNNLSGASTQSDGIDLYGINGGTVSSNTIEGSSYDGILIGASGNIAITGNVFSQNGKGVTARLSDGATDPHAAAIDFGGLQGFAPGAWNGDANTLGGFTVHNNTFSGNLNGIWNYDSASVNAANNWWGVSTGPTNAGNSGGTGDVISSNITFSPWYTNSGMSILSTGGAVDVSYTSPTDGQADLPAGITDVVLTNTTVLDLSSSVNAASGGNIIAGGATLTLNDFSSGNLSNKDLSVAQTLGDQSVTVTQAVTLQSGTNTQPIVLSNSDLSNISVSIPDDTTVLAGSGWDGKIEPPKSGSSAGNAPAGFSVGGTVIEVGSPGNTLLFDTPVKIVLAGVTGAVGYKPAGSSTWVQITNACGGSYSSPTAPTFPGECYTSNGTDTTIYTYHFTSFAALNAVSSGGSSGGGGSSSSGGWGGAAGGGPAPTCGDTKPSSAPGSLSASATGANEVTLTWSKAGDPVTYYLVTLGTSPGSQQWGNPNVGNTTSYTVKGLSGGTTYYFRVRAGNGCAPGDFSGEVSATPGGPTTSGTPEGFSQGVLGTVNEATPSSEISGTESATPAQKTSGGFKNFLLPLAVLALLVASFLIYRRKP